MRAVVHIGVEKTGSSALQHAFATNRIQLQQAGFFYPVYDRADAHWHLPLLAAPFENVADLWMERGVASPADAVPVREVLWRGLEEDVAQHHGKTFIFSSEHCHSRIVDRSSVELLKTHLSALFNDITIVIYIRRQDTLASSYHNNYLIGGGAIRDPLKANDSIEYFDIRMLIERWQSVFGGDNIIVRLWQQSQSFSTPNDFAGIFSIPIDFQNSDRANGSLSIFQRHILLAVNGLTDAEATIGEIARSFVVKARRFGQDGTPHRRGALEFIDRSSAAGILEKFHDSNEWVRTNFFPDQRSLFDEDISAYCDDLEFDSDFTSLCSSSARALCAAAHEWAIVRSELAYYRGRSHINSGSLTAALEEFSEGIRSNPDHAALWHMAAVTHLALGQLDDAHTCACRALRLEPDNDAHAIILKNIGKSQE